MIEKKLKVLLITGIVTSEHDPKINAMLRRMLESTGRFEVKITEEFRGATADTLKHYDAVLVNYDGRQTHTSPYIGWGRETEQAFYDFVASGKGVIMFHSSLIKGEPELAEEFVKLSGCDFSFMNGGRKSPKLEFQVDVNVDAHPITKGLAASWLTPQDDFFVNVRLDPESDITVLATVRDSAEDYDLSKAQAHRKRELESLDVNNLPGINTDQPVAWTHAYGHGRVVSIFIGHGIDTIRNKEFVALFCRSAEWAACGKVTLDPPNLDNENRYRVWPYYADMTIHEFAKWTEY